jgi:hypothetical protein
LTGVMRFALALLATGLLSPQAVPLVAVPTAPRPWFGVLQAHAAQASILTAANIKTVTLELGWDAFEPVQGEVNSDYVSQQRSNVANWQDAGFKVILDTGLQYPPAWVFNTPGGARFVDQRGMIWNGGTGSKIVNAVFNASVRAAEATYYSRIASAFAGISFAAVRVGGLNMGELSYPPAVTGSDTLWMYDETAQINSPVRGWKPGAGTSTDARTAVNYYLGAINDYARWLLRTTSDNFPTARLLLMLPSWGLRPGHLTAAIAGGLSGHTNPEVNGLLTGGLDWVTQVNLLVPYGIRGVAYTTWLDAPTNGTSPQDLSPAEYLYTLTSPRQVGLAGENTGVANVAALQLSINRVGKLKMQGMLWMTATNLIDQPVLLKTYSAASSAG